MHTHRIGIALKLRQSIFYLMDSSPHSKKKKKAQGILKSEYLCHETCTVLRKSVSLCRQGKISQQLTFLDLRGGGFLVYQITAECSATWDQDYVQ